MTRCKLLTKPIFIIYGLILISIILYNLSTPIVEGLTSTVDNNVLVGVGADYNLYTYTGSAWNVVKTPSEIAKADLLDIGLGPGGDLYAVGTDFKLYKDISGALMKVRQPTSTQIMALTTINDQLIVVGQDYKLYNYNIPTATINPMPGKTGPVISVVVFDGSQYGVGKDNKLYRWINNEWGVFDADANLRSIGIHNDDLVGVGLDKKLYKYDANAKSSSSAKSPPMMPMKGVCHKPGSSCKNCEILAVKKNLGAQYATDKMFPTICPSRGNKKDCNAAGGQWGPSGLSCDGDTSCKNVKGIDGCKTRCLKNSNCKYYAYEGSASTGNCMLFGSCTDPTGTSGGYTKYKTYSLEGVPQNLTPGKKWIPIAKEKDRKLISIYTFTHAKYVDLGFT